MYFSYFMQHVYIVFIHSYLLVLVKFFDAICLYNIIIFFLVLVILGQLKLN